MKHYSDKRKWIPVIMLCLMAGLSLWISFVLKQRTLKLYHELAGERYAGEEKEYGQISVFFAQSEKKTPADIKEYRNGIMSRLSEDDNLDSEQKGRPYIDAYTAVTEAEIRKDDSTVRAQVYAVGGDFFMIHPIPLLSGDYLRGEDPYTIVLDDYMAWNLFGSSNVAGMKLWIGDKVFTVSGVVKTDDSKDAMQAYGNYNAVYIPYEAFTQKGGEGADKGYDVYDAYDVYSGYGDTQDVPAIICYEAVVYNPIKHYAKSVVSEACGMEDLTDSEREAQRSSLDFGTSELVENTGRYKPLALYETLKKNKYGSMRTNAIVYPYWENLARLEEQHQIRWKLFAYALMAVPLVALIVWIIMLARKLTLRKVLYVLSFPFRKLYAWVDSHVPDKKELEAEEAEEAETDAERDDEIDDEEQASRLQDSSLRSE